MYIYMCACVRLRVLHMSIGRKGIYIYIHIYKYIYIYKTYAR